MTEWPTEIKLRDGGKILTVTFESDARHDISAELLRVESPSAEVKGHGPGQETLQWGKRDVTITRVEAVGNYAIRLSFSDGHASGIYTWTYLSEMGRDHDQMLERYLVKLAAAGLRR
jgi:DUF971 family protein